MSSFVENTQVSIPEKWDCKIPQKMTALQRGKAGEAV